VRPSPGGDGPVAGEGPAITGLFVAPERADRVLLAQGLEDGHGLAPADDERLAQGGERVPEFDQRFADEGPVPAGGVGLPPEAGLDDVERQDGATGRGLGQGCVVMGTQIALEPDDVQGRGGVYGRGK
jgi:hypothetical protein